MDLQLTTELYATTPKAQTEFLENHSSSATDDCPDHSFETAVVYFTDVENRCSQQRVEKFFKKQPTAARTDREFEIRLRALKIAIRPWTKRFFHKDSADKAPLDLLRLANEQPELMEYINAASSSPVTKTWEEWLDAKRADIVFSIVGKVFEMHVFGHEMFGASPTQLRRMRKKDREMMNENGKLPNRSAALSSLFTTQN